MWTAIRTSLTRMIRLLERGLLRWIEMFGENPCISRDTGILAWRHLHEHTRPAGEPEVFAGELVPRGDPTPGRAPGALPSSLRPSVRRALHRHRHAPGARSSLTGL